MIADAHDLVILNARVWAHPDDEISEPRTIVVRRGLIQILGGDIPADAATPVVDVGGRVLVAGFHNCHVHFTEKCWSRARRAPAAELQAHLDDMLLSRGFTTVLDLASDSRITGALTRRIEAGELRGPRVVSAGTGIRPWRGLPHYVRDSIPWYARLFMPAPLTALGARLVVALQARQGASLTKLFTGSYVKPTTVKPMRPAVARAAAAEAHRRSMLVLAHPSDERGTSIALDAGVDALAHLPSEREGTDALLERAAREGVRVVPTLSMFEMTASSDEGYLAPLRAALAGFRAAGGAVLFGTDVGYMAHRGTEAEFAAMQASGMSSADILRSLTTEPAAFLGRAREGVVRVGSAADLTVLEVNAEHVSPSDFSLIHAVIRGGRVIHGGNC
jgi:imidazolonepropionase-like amidohydrolase